LKDSASFDGEVLKVIYGEFPQCFLCCKTAIEANHIIGRGYLRFGIGRKLRDKKEREAFSSPYNSSPLCRICHSMGGLHTKEMERKLLDMARVKVREAITLELYCVSSHDRLFLENYSL